MSNANVRSVDAVRFFQAAVVRFQEEARLCASSLEMQLLRIIGWLERERPGFWKREIENCYKLMSEARVRLHKCQMRRVGDFRPTCFEERKDLERCKNELQFSQKQIGVVKQWTVAAHHEANEYHGRSSQLTRVIEREIPRLLALLGHTIDRLEAYGNVQVPGQYSAAAAGKSEQTESEQTEPDSENNEAEQRPNTPAVLPEENAE